MNTTKHSDVMVCVDCYFAHHYGMTERDGQWYAGDNDTPIDRKPLTRLGGFELADNTDAETGEGIDDFSWSDCEGCESTLGGSRFRLAVFAENRPLT